MDIFLSSFSMKKILLPFFMMLALTGFSTILRAQPGLLDKTFGNNGFVLTNVGPVNNSFGFDVVLQPDRKTVVSGKAQISSSLQVAVLMRYKINGDLDSSFGKNGLLLESFTKQFDNFSVLKIQQDGKFVVGGLSMIDNNYYVLFARYNTDGTLDNTFRNRRTALKYYGFGAVATDIVIQPDKKILLLINNNQDITYLAQTQVERYNEDGTIDSSFGTNGNFTYTGNFWFTKFAADKWGRIICMSGDNGVTSLMKLNPNGKPDKTFGKNGIATMQVSPYDGSQNLVTQPDGKIIVCGFLQASNFVDILFSVYRFDTNGSLDKTFNGTGINSTKINGIDYVYDVAFQRNGKLIATGYTVAKNGSPYIALMRYNTLTGHTDSTWGKNGIDTVSTTWDNKKYSYAVASAVSADGERIVVTGNQGGNAFQRNQFLTARFLLHATPPQVIASSTDNAEVKQAILSSVYPNPAKKSTTISFNLAQRTHVHMHIINMNGQTVSTIYNGTLGKGNQTMHANVSNLPSGVYYVLLQTGSNTKHIKLVKL
jgi:uncharacterized delta-60 repeat protein